MTTMDDWNDYQRVRPVIASVMDARFYSPEWLDAEIWSGRARIWSTERAAIVATLKVYPTGAREVHGLVAVGALDDVVGLIPAAENWGRSMGCITATIDSRQGWARQMQGFGYLPYQQCVRKEL